MDLKSKSLHKNKNGIVAIDDPASVQAGLDGTLTLDGKPVLVIRGNDCTKIVFFIFREFSRRLDRSGEKFTFSLKKRGVCERDIYGGRVKVSPANIESYIKEWFVLTELLHVTVGKILVIIDKVPRMSSQLWTQNRFVGAVAGLFEITD